MTAQYYQLDEKFNQQTYEQYGKGLALNDLYIRRGASGSLVFNQDQQISGIFFAVASHSDPKPGEKTLVQLLRLPVDESTTATVKDNCVPYDLIFGNRNTTHYYTQFAKQHHTHLYEQIQQSNDQLIKFIDRENVSCSMVS
ncbi:DUF31 family putative serine protease [Mycoplasmoides pneumoniae]|uniref:Lipoprotein n=2 Tax=Mycoplasmoides pneumoniae TaxID=2104 RepID=A0AAV5N765_MYCPM|nr:hypothetical protein [Mycoplasmoides pneumoniae]ALA30742.1 hypothetical protein B434_00940 [Mycoplasmoides pneumoniae 19294]ALA31846.1 hypothetical protein F536_03270 [Mycoplasmoides pneumoniae 39443]ALA36076.1 hypothetical protein F539_03275 [Mycoplasmoides pneumoniae FH]ALA36786.1 hypothetical protein F538_03290 [Mycoplasmoides pneumoniae M1139]ALA37497.1 hypothetical protein RF41_03255 [Mycoplasmoides pneumoniae]